ncbi:MAG: hypothetical protein V3S98_10265, partial [Dehalococcoidia bacterium]
MTEASWLERHTNVKRFAGWFGVTWNPDDEEKHAAELLVVQSLAIGVAAGVAWAPLLAAFGEYTAASVPLAYAVLTLVPLLVFRTRLNPRIFRYFQFTLMAVLPLLLMLVLGGFINSSAVVVWGLP